MAQQGTGQAREVLDGLDFNAVLRECLSCALLAVNDQGRITLLNPEAEPLLGLRSEELPGPTVESLPTALRALVAEAFLTGQPASDREMVLHDKSGLECTLRVTTVLTRPDPGQPRQVLVALHDITGARMMESNLRWLDRLASIGTLSASMAHEIKNAMVAVKTFVELAREEGELLSMTDLVSREIRRIDSILSQMLRFAAPSKATFAPVHVHDVLEHAVGVIQPQLQDRHIVLQCGFEAWPDLVKADEYQLEQAFLNLLLNSLEATGAEGRLTVTTQIALPGELALASNPAAPVLKVDIADTGVGIAPENLKRLFEPFFSTKPGGTGLGLAICRRIMEEHHGELSVQSEVGRGTTITVVLPLFQK
jgi:two-component system nitrogen regulation sensor histidine kinase GlnL